MHEVSLVEALYDEAERAIRPHRLAAVRRLRVRVGALAGVDPELFRIAFEGTREGRGLGAATLEVAWEPSDWRCEACGAAVADGETLVCRTCGGPVALAGGDALILERIELEVRDV